MLNGGIGIDKLYGGEGADTFILNLGDGYATLHDFTAGDDILKFTNIGEVSMEYKDENSLFYSGTDYLGVANGVQLKRQEDDTFA